MRFPAEMPYAKHVYHLYAVMASNRDALHKILGDKGIATGFHYPIPVHLLPAFEDLGYHAGQFPHAEQAANEVLSLPMFPELTQAQSEEVSRAVRGLASKTAKPPQGVAAPA